MWPGSSPISDARLSQQGTAVITPLELATEPRRQLG